MTSQMKKIAVVLLAIMLFTTACNMPASVSPSTLTFPTPDLTITALFEFITTAQSAQTATPPPPTVPPIQPATLTPSVTPPATSTTAPTVQPTNTSAPTEVPVQADTSSGGETRRGSRVLAYYFQAEPEIDGDFDEAVWDLDRYNVDHVVYGENRWGGEDDLSGTVMLGWDDYYLYIAARVVDDKYVQNASGEDIFKGDSIEFLFDKNLSGDFNRRSLDSDDYQIGISPGQDEPGKDIEAYLWYPRSKERTLDEDEVKAAAVPTDDGYRIEARISWDIFGIEPDVGDRYGFAFSISDNDNSDNNVQQSMVSNVSNRHLTDPTTWGDLALEGHQ